MASPPAPPLPDEPPGPDQQPDTDVADSNPNASGPAGLAGGMGISSERIPADPDSIEGTGSRGTATSRAEGTWATSGGGKGRDEEHAEEHAEEPGTPRPQSDDPAEGPDTSPERRTAAGFSWQGIDRTVGEPSPPPVRRHRFDPAKNPGHSHG